MDIFHYPCRQLTTGAKQKIYFSFLFVSFSSPCNFTVLNLTINASSSANAINLLACAALHSEAQKYKMERALLCLLYMFHPRNLCFHPGVFYLCTDCDTESSQEYPANLEEMLTFHAFKNGFLFTKTLKISFKGQGIYEMAICETAQLNEVI